MTETPDRPLDDDDMNTSGTTDGATPEGQDADGVDLGQDADTQDHGGGGQDADSSDSGSTGSGGL